MHTPTAITFIDGSLPGIDTLIAGLPAGASYFVLDKQRDGLHKWARCWPATMTCRPST